MVNNEQDLLYALNLLYKSDLVSRKRIGDFVNFRYKNKIFYNDMWGINPALLEARGIVFNEKTKKIVHRPFNKIFNDFEKHCKKIGKNDTFLAVKKINGFMGSVSVLDNGEFIVGTTGSFCVVPDFSKVETATDNKFLQIQAEMFSKNLELSTTHEDYTFIFEICSNEDKHFIDEEEGIYLLGVRHKKFGGYLSPFSLEIFAEKITKPGGKIYTPSVLSDSIKFSDAVEEAKEQKHEGFVLYDKFTGFPVTKLKTSYYLSLKAMSRIGKGNISLMFYKPEKFRKRIDEEFYDVHDYLVRNNMHDYWVDSTEEERKEFLVGYFSGLAR